MSREFFSKSVMLINAACATVAFAIPAHAEPSGKPLKYGTDKEVYTIKVGPPKDESESSPKYLDVGGYGLATPGGSGPGIQGQVAVQSSALAIDAKLKLGGPVTGKTYTARQALFDGKLITIAPSVPLGAFGLIATNTPAYTAIGVAIAGKAKADRGGEKSGYVALNATGMNKSYLGPTKDQAQEDNTNNATKENDLGFGVMARFELNKVLSDYVSLQALIQAGVSSFGNSGVGSLGTLAAGIRVYPTGQNIYIKADAQADGFAGVRKDGPGNIEHNHDVTGTISVGTRAF